MGGWMQENRRDLLCQPKQSKCRWHFIRPQNSESREKLVDWSAVSTLLPQPFALEGEIISCQIVRGGRASVLRTVHREIPLTMTLSHGWISSFWSGLFLDFFGAPRQISTEGIDLFLLNLPIKTDIQLLFCFVICKMYFCWFASLPEH